MGRRGMILLEVLVSLGLFAVAAALILASLRDVTRGLDRDERIAQAADLARSRMSELEAGLVAIGDLRSGSGAAGEAGKEPVWTRFGVEAQAVRSEFPGISLVEIAVFDSEDAGRTRLFTLRQLIGLSAWRGSGAEEPRTGGKP